MTRTKNRIVWSKGHKTYLRPVQTEDLPDFNRWINDPAMETLLMRTNPVSQPGQQAWYEQITKDDPNRLTCSICLIENDQLIGNMFLGIDPHNQKGSTGTIIGESSNQNKGYGTDAKMQMLRYAFMTRAVRKVTSRIFAHNHRSQRYGQKCGYKHIATIPQEYFRDGAWIDEMIFEVYREDWLPLWDEYKKDLK